MPRVALRAGLFAGLLAAAVGVPGLSSAGLVPGARALPSALQIQQLVMATPEVGYALFETYEGSCGAWTASTFDGGTSFTSPVEVQSWRCGAEGAGSVAGISADASSDVFVYGRGGFSVSHDAGATWRRGDVPGVVLQVVAHGGVVWLVREACAAGTEHPCPLRVEVSHDAGRSFATTAAQPRGADSSGATLVVANDGMAYVFPAGVPNHLERRFWATPDGGVTWRLEQAACVPFSDMVAAVAPSGALWTVCPSEPGAGSQGKEVAVSYDRAQSWRVGARCGGGTASAEDLCAGYAQNLVALTGEKAFLSTDRYGVFVTTDGGTRWREVEPVMNSGAGYLCEVQFVGALDGFVVTTPTFNLWRSTDGGRRWRKTVPRFD